jgi:hypothetical protein
MYVLYEKTYIDRLGKRLDDEINILDGDTIEELLMKLKSKNIKASRRTLFYALKTKSLINGKYLLYKINR